MTCSAAAKVDGSAWRTLRVDAFQNDRPSDVEPTQGPALPGPSLHPEGPVPLQSRRAAASAVGSGASLSAAAAENGREAYVTSRASLPGQRSGS